MAKCKYCGEPLGLLRKTCKNCKELRNNSFDRILYASRAFLHTGEGDIRKEIDQISSESKIDYYERNRHLLQVWEVLVERVLDDGILTEEEEHRLATFRNELQLDQEALDRKGSYTRVVQSAVLRDIVNGIIPNSITITGGIPFNITKNEKLVWLFNNVNSSR